MPIRAWWGNDPDHPRSVEEILRDRVGQPVYVFIAGFNYSKPDGGLWGYVKAVDADTLALESGSGKSYIIRVADISMVLVDPTRK